MKLPLFSLLSICIVVVVVAAALSVEGGLSSELVLSDAYLSPLSLMMVDVVRLLQQTAEPVPRLIYTTAFRCNDTGQQVC